MKKDKITKITDFEETCMWMSYRYAIGRHSIASVMHACDIAEHFFYRLPNDRKEFTSFDIAREIDNSLRCIFHLYIEYPNENKNFHPFETLMEFIKNENIKDLNEFNKFKSIRFNSNNGIWKVSYSDSYVDAYHSNPEGALQKEEYDIHKDYGTMDLEDLLHWQKLAACFDIHNLKVVHTLYEGKEQDHICFKSYFLQYGTATEIDLQGKPYQVNDLKNIWWDEHWIDLDSYLSGQENRYISDEYITNIRDITDEECKKFEGFV